ncbi:hypothetical protein [Croceicoccus naphthovorans]|uniref:hypothetical protein n=1 Tax=Croceicoccus naphthovorans TaxID=1348774 RepID=UPI000B1AA0DA|nr:hypothetical protein [Croceicoccus naphthovorans]MBB3991090.1 hypothetical protein [Croceicoccus naphthovorans]
MEFEICDHETLPSQEPRPVIRQLDRGARNRQQTREARPSRSDGLPEVSQQMAG